MESAIELLAPNGHASGSFSPHAPVINIHAIKMSAQGVQGPRVKISHKIISSTALPKVTFISAPTVSPISLATLSVA